MISFLNFDKNGSYSLQGENLAYYPMLVGYD